MLSVRLGDRLEERLARAADAEGVTVSELIRQAVSQRCDAILDNRLDSRLADIVGSVRSGGGWSTLSDRELGDLVQRQAERRPRRS